jgi:hypothetical protein
LALPSTGGDLSVASHEPSAACVNALARALGFTRTSRMRLTLEITSRTTGKMSPRGQHTEPAQGSAEVGRVFLVLLNTLSKITQHG